jgi:hypothetical protein
MRTMSRGRRLLLIAPFAIAGLILFAFLGGEIVRRLWNWLLPPLFGWPALTFWQALGLLALCRILFGGLGIHGGRGHSRPPLSERWKHMTPEERERFRRGMWGRLGFAPTATESEGGA